MLVGVIDLHVGRFDQGLCKVSWPSCWSVWKVSMGLKQECSSQAGSSLGLSNFCEAWLFFRIKKIWLNRCEFECIKLNAQSFIVCTINQVLWISESWCKSSWLICWQPKISTYYVARESGQSNKGMIGSEQLRYPVTSLIYVIASLLCKELDQSWSSYTIASQAMLDKH